MVGKILRDYVWSDSEEGVVREGTSDWRTIRWNHSESGQRIILTNSTCHESGYVIWSTAWRSAWDSTGTRTSVCVGRKDPQSTPSSFSSALPGCWWWPGEHPPQHSNPWLWAKGVHQCKNCSRIPGMPSRSLGRTHRRILGKGKEVRSAGSGSCSGHWMQTPMKWLEFDPPVHPWHYAKVKHTGFLVVHWRDGPYQR